MRVPKVIQKRNLPHIQPQGATFFATYLLHNAIPTPLKEKLKAENELRILALKVKSYAISTDEENRRYFKKFDNLLDTIHNDIYWLRDERLAQITADSWHFGMKKELSLSPIASCQTMYM